MSAMQNISVSREAMALISEKCQDPAIASRKKKDSIPLLSWAIRVTHTDNAGHRTDLGPQFFFTWSNAKQVEEYGYLTFKLEDDGELALAPGEFFRTGKHRIDQKDGRLTLFSND